MIEASRLGVSWFTWHVALSPDIPDGVHDVLERWPFHRIVQAHAVLEAMSEAREEARRRAERERHR